MPNFGWFLSFTLVLAYPCACDSDCASSGVCDEVGLLQVDAAKSYRERIIANRPKASLLQGGLFSHRFKSILSRTTKAVEAPMIDCADTHGALGVVDCRDVNGRKCNLCGQPGPMFPEYADGFIVRSDCGNQTEYDPDRPLASFRRPLTDNFLPPKTGPPESWTNAWCETNSQKSCADADANRDYFYYVAGYVIPPGMDYDFYYCKYNGYLEEAFVKNMHNYSALYEQAAAVCALRDAEFNVSSITIRQMGEHYKPDLGPPTPEQARWLGAWTCAMGGPGGDMAYCAYSYKELDDGNFCMYPFEPGYKGTLFEGTPMTRRWECLREGRQR